MLFSLPFSYRTTLTFISLLFTIGFSVCQTHNSNDVDRLRQATDRFCLALYQSLTAGKDTQSNVFFSPLSINSALLMTYLGSTNSTRDELGKALGVKDVIGTTTDHLNRAYSAINDIFKGDSARNYNLSLANRLCVRSDISLKRNFQHILKQHYDTDISSYDFAEHSESSRVEINTWVEKMTNKKIQNLLPQGTVTPQTMMILLNAIYFKADWQYKFDKFATSEISFFVGGIKETPAKMMTARRRLFYAQNDQLQAQVVEIPYKSEELSMIVLLPNDKNGLPAVEGKLNVKLNGKLNIWQSMQEQMDMRMVILTLPKFKLEETYDLIQPLSNLGINRLFGSAELGGISDNITGFGVSDVVHKSFVGKFRFDLSSNFMKSVQK